MERISREVLHYNVLKEVSKRGSCKRLQVGALLINDNRIVSMGYNGPIKGAKVCNSTNCVLEESCTRALHAEQNVIANCAKHGTPTEGTTMWVEYNPCPTCARLIVQAGVQSVVYIKDFRDRSGLSILHKGGVTVRKYGELHIQDNFDESGD